MAILLPPPPLNFLLSILCVSVCGGIEMAAQIFPLCRLLPLTIVDTFFLPSGRKHRLMDIIFVRPLIERGLKVMVLLLLWQVAVLSGLVLEQLEFLVLEEVEFPVVEEAELVDEVVGLERLHLELLPVMPGDLLLLLLEALPEEVLVVGLEVC